MVAMSWTAPRLAGDEDPSRVAGGAQQPLAQAAVRLFPGEDLEGWPVRGPAVQLDLRGTEEVAALRMAGRGRVCVSSVPHVLEKNSKELEAT